MALIISATLLQVLRSELLRRRFGFFVNVLSIGMTVTSVPFPHEMSISRKKIHGKCCVECKRGAELISDI